MKIFNTLTHKKEEFETIEADKVRYYSCGPTVYDNVHIGNLRAYLFNDFLEKTLILDGYNVDHVMNITDVDDKTIRKSGGKMVEFQKLTQEYEDKFWHDLELLNVAKPGKITRATQYIEKILLFITDLLNKDYAYKASDGSVYFSIEKFNDYGKLANLDRENLKSGARVGQDEYDKENPADFALWKAWDEKDGEIFWEPSQLIGETVIGKGRPGWSIECSVMSTDSLGDTIDLHTGGIDLVFPHHENEIAQSEARSGHLFVNFWVHNEHLLVDGQKMSKSLQNFYTLDDVIAKGFSPLDFRYLVFSSHYRSKLNFTWESLQAAKNAREKLVRFVADNPATGEICQVYKKKFMSKLNDDLMTPEALAVVWELVKDPDKSIGKKIATLREWDKTILGFGLFETVEVPAMVLELVEQRKEARSRKNFDESDRLRNEIEKLGWGIKDTGNETLPHPL